MSSSRSRASIAASLFLLCATGSCSGYPWSFDPSRPPELVLEALKAEVPGDGAIHIQSRGMFNIAADTRMCRGSVDNPDYFQEAVSTCVQNAGREPIFIAIIQSGGNPGKHEALLPYRLTFAAWQGDPANGGAVWIGEIARKAGRLHPDAVGSADQISSTSTRAQQLDYYSTGWDQFDLSKAFLLNIGQEPAQIRAAPSPANDVNVAEFERFVTGKFFVTSQSSNEAFEQDSIWKESYLGADLTVISGTWRVSKNAEGWLELCRTSLGWGFPDGMKLKMLPKPEVECSLIKPFYEANAFINLRIAAPSGPYIYFTPPAKNDRR